MIAVGDAVVAEWTWGGHRFQATGVVTKVSGKTVKVRLTEHAGEHFAPGFVVTTQAQNVRKESNMKTATKRSVQAPKMDAFTRAYFETALWSSTDESRDDGGDPLDANYSIDDISPETRTEMISDCADFQEKYSKLLVESGMDFSRAGHNFWLSRNGHGAGFFDDDQDELQEAAKSYGEFTLYVGDDGQIHGTPLSGTREARAPRVVRDFNTLNDLVNHAARDLGATHTSGSEAHTKIYFPRGGQHPYEEATVWRKSGYWHAQGPGARTGVAGLPAGARPIAGHAGRRAAETHRVPGAAHGLEWHRYREGFVGTVNGERRFLLDPTADGDWILWHVNTKTGAQDRKLGRFNTSADAKDAARLGTMQEEPQFKLGAPRPSTSVRDAVAVDRRGTPKADPRAVDFFYKHAGYGHGPGETPEQGRKRGAVALAQAEQEATARGWRVEWSDDPEGWDSLGDIDPETVKEVLSAVLYDENEQVLASLGSIVDPDRATGRVIEAELALEALSGQQTNEPPTPKAKRSVRKRSPTSNRKSSKRSRTKSGRRRASSRKT